MELFSEIYSTYYRAVQYVLRAAAEKPLTVQELRDILSENSFSESTYYMLPKLQDGDWAVLKSSDKGYQSRFTTLKEHPLTVLQLSWLKAILSDPRIRLFLGGAELDILNAALANIPPLFRPCDFHIFDKAGDGDDYEDELYRKNVCVFREAIHSKSAVSVQYEGGKGNRVAGTFWPYRFEYSGKDDKFRVLCYKRSGNRKIHYVLNMSRVLSAVAADSSPAEEPPDQIAQPRTQRREVQLEITRERNALERCMVQFAHYEKRAEYDEKTDRYTCFIKYNVMDETELVIRVLSFGPTVKVLGPQVFLDEIRRRVQRQAKMLEIASESI